MDFTLISNQLSDFQRAFLLRFYRSQFWILQKQTQTWFAFRHCFIGHNFGDYKNCINYFIFIIQVLSVTILETTKTQVRNSLNTLAFYRSQFWRLQKHRLYPLIAMFSFIGHNFGDYKNLKWYQLITP